MEGWRRSGRHDMRQQAYLSSNHAAAGRACIKEVLCRNRWSGRHFDLCQVQEKNQAGAHMGVAPMVLVTPYCEHNYNHTGAHSKQVTRRLKRSAYTDVEGRVLVSAKADACASRLCLCTSLTHLAVTASSASRMQSPVNATSCNKK